MLARIFGVIKITPNFKPPAAWFYIISREKHTSVTAVTAVTTVTMFYTPPRSQKSRHSRHGRHAWGGSRVRVILLPAWLLLFS